MSPELLSSGIIHILRGICYYDSKASWDPSNGRLRISFEPDSRDLYLVIGVDGCVIKGLQNIALLIGKLNGYSAKIHVVESHGPGKEEHAFVQSYEFNPAEIERITSGLLAAAFNREVATRYKHLNDRVDIKVDADTAEQATVAALGEALYAYGYRQGCIIKLSASPLNSPIGKVVCRK